MNNKDLKMCILFKFICPQSREWKREITKKVCELNKGPLQKIMFLTAARVMTILFFKYKSLKWLFFARCVPVWAFIMCFCSFAFRVAGGRRSQQDQLVELHLPAPSHGQPSHSGKHWQTAAHIKVYYVGQSEGPDTDCNRCFFYVAILSQCLTQHAHLHTHTPTQT